MFAFNRPTCNLQAQEQLISDAIASGVPITILPDYTPKPRPAHSVKSWKVMNLPKPKKPPTATKPGESHTNKERRNRLLKCLERVGIMTPEQITEKFGYAKPEKAVSKINSEHDRLIIRTKKVAVTGKRRKAVYFCYAG